MLAITNSEPPGNSRSQERSHQSGVERKSTKRVLLVDDYSLFREVLAVVLEENADFDKCLQAGSLAEARRVLARHNASELALAIVDLELPNEGSGELMADLDRTGTPVLALATRRDPEHQGHNSRADKVLTTDVSIDDILDAVRHLMNDWPDIVNSERLLWYLERLTGVDRLDGLPTLLQVLLPYSELWNLWRQHKGSIGIRVLVAIEEDYRSYREVLAAGIRILRPHMEVSAVGLGELEEEIKRFDPHVVICTRKQTASTGQRVAWVELALEPLQPTVIRVAGRYSEKHNTQLETLIGVFDEAERLVGK